MNREFRGGNWEKRGLSKYIKQSRLLKKVLDEFDEQHAEIEKYRFMPYADAMKVKDHFRESNRKVAKDYLNVDGDLFEYNTEPYEHVSLDIQPEDIEQVSDYAMFLLNKIAGSTGKERRKLRT